MMEALSLKGRRGSGIAGDRCAYLDTSLKPRWDWEKCLYTLRVFGRLSYNPDTEPVIYNIKNKDVLEREFRFEKLVKKYFK